MAAASSKSAVPSGWYPDPNNSAINRWWSGSEWTKDVSPREAVDAVKDAFENPVATARATVSRSTPSTTSATTTPTATGATRAQARPAASGNSAASYAASSARPATPAAPFRAPARSRPAPEIMQPPYAFNRTMSTFALIAVIVGLGLIAALLLN